MVSNSKSPLSPFKKGGISVEAGLPVSATDAIIAAKKNSPEVLRMARLTREEVLHIARLARLGLSDDKIGRMQEQLSNILENFEILKQVDTANVPPTTQSITLQNVMSPDVIAPSLTPDEVLSTAPDQEDNSFKVRAVLE